MSRNMQSGTILHSSRPKQPEQSSAGDHADHAKWVCDVRTAEFLSLFEEDRHHHRYELILITCVIALVCGEATMVILVFGASLDEAHIIPVSTIITRSLLKAQVDHRQLGQQQQTLDKTSFCYCLSAGSTLPVGSRRTRLPGSRRLHHRAIPRCSADRVGAAAAAP